MIAGQKYTANPTADRRPTEVAVDFVPETPPDAPPPPKPGKRPRPSYLKLVD